MHTDELCSGKTPVAVTGIIHDGVNNARCDLPFFREFCEKFCELLPTVLLCAGESLLLFDACGEITEINSM